jgi:hypothetical protein
MRVAEIRFLVKVMLSLLGVDAIGSVRAINSHLRRRPPKSDNETETDSDLRRACVTKNACNKVG